ncbi:MAG: class I SAM-dependent DNA methyltransferase [Verrucomicrobiales bacterium]
MAKTPSEFVKRWTAASASERSNSQLFLSELCDLLGVSPPEPTFEGGYAFEFPVAQQQRDGSTSQGRIDLYKRGCFVLESKQFHAQQLEATSLELALKDAESSVSTGSATPPVSYKKSKSSPVRGTERWDDAMFKARGQAERYIRSLPPEDPNPPFLIVVDIGDTFEIYADFTQAGKAYLPFPDPRSFRIRISHLERDEVRQRLRLIWTSPFELDPSRRSAAVTLEIAGHLAELGKSLEAAGHPAPTVAEFLTRCLFCMFAEDVGLLPKDSFRDLLNSLPADGLGFQEIVSQLFREMNTGTGKGISVVLRKKLLHFNGGLFAQDTVLPMNGTQLGLLKAASKLDWKSVEPAIFGTLLERALNPHERHKLGAHYTPRAYVERLVLPTVIEPLRSEWETVRAATLTHARAGKVKEAREETLSFHKKLCEVRVLDPACGSGNFLYVTLEHLKRLEGEVLDVAATFGESMLLELSTHTVDPHQFLGIEVNPRAASITELVLWIGYLQWHFRTRGQTMPAEPVLKRFKNIECRDAVLAWDGDPQPAKDDNGNVVTVWDRRSYKLDMLSGRDIPDESKRVPLLEYLNPHPSIWPETDYIVGNPPFLGKLRLREATGDGYAEALRGAYPEVPESADFVLYWWFKSAELARQGRVKRFGLITTNSLRQTFARRIVQNEMQANPPLALIFAIPDHPWVDTEGGAAVRIAMTVGTKGPALGTLSDALQEEPQDDGSSKVSMGIKQGLINSELTIGTNSAKAISLKSNIGLTSMGVMLAGRGFVIEKDEALACGAGKEGYGSVLRKLCNGRDLLDSPRNMFVIDFTGLSLEEARTRFPELFQIVVNRVKPERETNRDPQFKARWWLFGRSRPELRALINKLKRYIATVETAKHRIFQFIEADILPEHKLIVVGSEDAFHLGVLSSRVHLVWALSRGALLEDRPVYPKSECFDPFPFPDCSESKRDTIRGIAEELDAHRKKRQARHPALTLTGMYNVVEKLRSNQPLTTKEKLMHEQGLISVLKQLHDDLDAAVFEAYGWSKSFTDDEILERVVKLNEKRAKEEASGIIRWLRPEYQNPKGKANYRATELDLVEMDTNSKKKRQKAVQKKFPWPKSLPERVRAVAESMRGTVNPCTVEDIAQHFARSKVPEVKEILETLVVMGQLQRGKERGSYVG